MRRLLSYILLISLISGLLLPLSAVQAEEAYIYGVPVENLGNRRFNRATGDLGQNPSALSLDGDSGVLTANPQLTRYSLQFEQIPTKTITLQSVYPEEGIRTIYVNTQVTVTSDPSNGLALLQQKFYVFYNKFGTLSIAFPRLADNTRQPHDETQPYIEYLEEGTQRPATQTLQTVSTDQAPYRVDTQVLTNLTYHMETVNAPSDYRFDFSQGLMAFNFLGTPDRSLSTYKFQVVDIPTQEIRIFSADGSGIRTVKVNTRILPTAIINGEERFFNYPYYLFHNKNGTISLITPNFAGNTSPENRDVYSEYVVTP